MRILIDLRCCQSPPPRGGVARYAEEATRALIAASRLPTTDYRLPQTEFLLFANGLSNPRRALPTISASNARWVITRWPNIAWNASSFVLRPSSFVIPDVVFLPNINFLPRLPARTRLVVTVHDLSFEHFSDCFTPKERLWHRMVRPRALFRRADAIIAVSETTKRDIVETYGIEEGKVRVVYPGVEHSNAANPIRMPQIPTLYSKHSNEIPRLRRVRLWSRGIRMFPQHYILALSELSPRKNLDGLVAAFEQLMPYALRLTAPLHLIIAGKHGSATRALERQIVNSPARDRIHLLGPVTDDEKAALLARAHVFAYPSFWEGFGFPPLEAMAAGVPVVASAGGALPEVLGDAALLVDPLDPAALARALARACTDDVLRADLVAKGRARVARYRWDTAGAHLLDILTQ